MMINNSFSIATNVDNSSDNIMNAIYTDHRLESFRRNEMSISANLIM